jgi:hypothetical protein
MKTKNKLISLFLALILLCPLIGCTPKTPNNLKIIYTSDYTIDPYTFTPFSQGFTCVYKNGHKGFVYVDQQGNCLPNVYQIAYPFEENGTATVYTKENQWAIINTKGEEIKTIQAPSDPDVTEIYKENDLFGVKEKSEKLTQPIFEWISAVSFDLNFAVLSEGEHKNVMIDRRGNIQVTLPDDCTSAKQNGDLLVCGYKNGYQLTDLTGKSLTPTYFDGIGNFDKRFAPIILDGKLGMINQTGAIVLTPELSMDPITPAYGEDKIVGTIDGKLTILSVEVH